MLLSDLARCPATTGVSAIGLGEACRMQNFRLDDFLFVNRKLAEWRAYFNTLAETNTTAVDPEARPGVTWLASELFKLGLDAREHVEKAGRLLSQANPQYAVLVHCLDEAVRSIDGQIRTQWTYHYGRNTSSISEYQYRWDEVLRAFPSSKFEIESACDLYALHHFTASVFHFMRLAEHGLRALASELSVSLPKNKPITHANWQDIIKHCDDRVKEVTGKAPAGDAKDAALAFYSAALSHLVHLKNAYRNDVMHARTEYGHQEAYDASHVTKNLMDLLATRLSERPRKKGFKNGKIDWGFTSSGGP